MPAVGVLLLKHSGVPLGMLTLLHSICKTIPEEAWVCGSLARVLDVSHNSLLEVPAAIGRVSILQVYRTLCFSCKISTIINV